MPDMITIPLAVAPGAGLWLRAWRLQRWADRCRWALEDAGYIEGRAAYGPTCPQERAGFWITGVTPTSGPDFCEISHFDAPDTDTRPFVARYRATLEAAGFRCKWDFRWDAVSTDPYVRFHVYPPEAPHV